MQEPIEPPPPSSSEVSLERQLTSAVDAPADVPRAFLLIVDGERAGRLHLLGSEAATIGRALDSSIRLDDPSTSGSHARVIFDAGTFYIEDAGSRNGTAVNGNQVTRLALSHKDAIRIGDTTLVFLTQSLDGDLRNYGRQATSPNGGQFISNQLALVHQPSVPPYPMNAIQPAPPANQQGMLPGYPMQYPSWQPPPHLSMPIPEAEPSAEASLVQLIQQLFKVLALLKRNAWLLIPLPVVCALIGWTSFYWLPARQYAEGTIRLSHSKTDISADNRGNQRAVFFLDPEANFPRKELVEQTLKTLGLEANQDLVEELVLAFTIQAPMGGEVYRVTFTKPNGWREARPEEVLEGHIANYLREEVHKSIKTLTGESEFLRKQLDSVALELKGVETEIRELKEKHPDSIPERANAVFESRQQLISRKQQLETETDRLRQQLTNAKQQLARSGSSVAPQSADVNPLASLLVTKKDALSKLKAGGLTDQHPQVRVAQNEVDALEKEIREKRTRGLSKLEWETDPRYQQLTQEATRIEGDLKVNQTELSRIASQLGQASGTVSIVPQVEFKLNELLRRQASLQQLQGELFQQHRGKLVQIELETADVHGHYQILSPPAAVNTTTSKFIAQRVGIGLGAGMVIALLLIAALEFRKFVRKHPELRAHT